MSTQTKQKPKIKVILVLKKITEEKLHEASLTIDKARYWLMRNTPFWGQLAMGLRDQFSYRIPTAATDGKVIIWNPDFIDFLRTDKTEKQVRYVLLHEISHCAFGHPWRFPPLIDKDGKKKKDEKANIACDHVINLRLNDEKDSSGNKLDIQMPEMGLADSKFKGMIEEEVYKLIPDPPPGNGGYGEDGDPTGGYEESLDGDTDGKGDKEDSGGSSPTSLKEIWERKVIEAAQAARALGQGNMPADLQRILDESLAEKTDWRNEMVDFTKNCISERNDWTRSPKRHAHCKVIMPRKRRDTMSRVVWVRDTSGSVDDQTVAYFNAKIEQCIVETGCHGFIFDCDADLHHEYPAGPGLEVPRTAKGGGGTDFRPPFKRVQEMIEEGEEIAGLIYLTDLFGSHLDKQDYPDFPTLWISITDQVAPFGRTVRVKIM